MNTRKMGRAHYLALAAVLVFLAVCAALSSCATAPRRPSNPLWPDCKDSCASAGGAGAFLMEDDDHLVCVCKKPAVQPMAFGGRI